MRISELQNPNTTWLESLLDYFICLPHTGQRNSLHTRANSPKRPFFHAIGDAIAYIFLVKILSFLDVYKSVRQEMFTLGKSSCYHVAKKWARGTPTTRLKGEERLWLLSLSKKRNVVSLITGMMIGSATSLEAGHGRLVLSTHLLPRSLL